VRPFAPQPFTRSYSTENKEAEASENAEAEDPVKKQLEAKEKEIVELKVFTSIY
jgi:molecular chaperone GrpE